MNQCMSVETKSPHVYPSEAEFSRQVHTGKGQDLQTSCTGKALKCFGFGGRFFVTHLAKTSPHAD